MSVEMKETNKSPDIEYDFSYESNSYQPSSVSRRPLSVARMVASRQSEPEIESMIESETIPEDEEVKDLDEDEYAYDFE
jgi:hypothetical protein